MIQADDLEFLRRYAYAVRDNVTAADWDDDLFDQINNTELDIGEDWTSRMVISPDLLIDLIEHYQLTNQRKAIT